MYGESLNSIIKEICKEKNIKLDILSYGFVLRLEKDNKEYYSIAYKFDLNSQVASRLAKDKYATYLILKRNAVPVIEHEIVFNNTTREDYCRQESLGLAKKFFQNNGKRIVIKPDNGLEGKNVYFCNKEEKIEEILNNIFKEDNTAVLCPYYNIKTEYRTIYLNGKCLLTYGKNIPYLIGNGKSNIKELVKSQMDMNIEDIPKEDIIEMDFSYVPQKDEKVKILWKHNLCGGAEPKILEDGELRRKIQDIVKRAGSAIKINFSSIDVIETQEGELKVLEVNSGVFMQNFMKKHPNGRAIVKEIYAQAIEEIFKN